MEKVFEKVCDGLGRERDREVCRERGERRSSKATPKVGEASGEGVRRREKAWEGVRRRSKA